MLLRTHTPKTPENIGYRRAVARHLEWSKEREEKKYGAGKVKVIKEGKMPLRGTKDWYLNERKKLLSS